METFTHGRLTVAHHDVGEGPAVVFIHNGGTSSTIWRHQIEDLSKDHRVIAVDLPGFGESELPEPAANLDEMVDLIIALIDEKELTPALMVGNCMGGNITASIADRDSSRVAGMVVINPLTADSFSGGSIGFLHTMERRFGAPTHGLRKAARHIRMPRFIGSMTLRFQLGRKGVERGVHHDAELLACQTRSDQLPALIDVLDDMSAYGGVDTLDSAPPVPTWIIWGEQNRVLSRNKAAGLAERLGAQEVKVLSNTGHLAMLEEPQQVTAIIRQFEQQISEQTKNEVVAR